MAPIRCWSLNSARNVVTTVLTLRVCAAALPGASHIVEGGVVLVTDYECIGCGACIESCPYDARFSHPEGHVDKCTFCIHRVRDGLKPACVSVCPTNCMYFGDMDDPNSEISNILKRRKYKVLAPEAGTDPKVYYLI
jgi:Fe-S-cluster-containing dehydrogenase component